MKTNIRRIVSAAVVAVMILSAAAFISCNQSEVEQNITVNMKITGSDGIDICDMPLAMTGIPSELTVLVATRMMCVDVYQIEFDYDLQLNTVKRIGADIGDLFLNDYPTEPPPTEEEEAAPDEEGEEEASEPEQEETDPEDVVSDHYYDWVCTINGVESTISDTIKDGDNIEWVWKQVAKELVEK